MRSLAPPSELPDRIWVVGPCGGGKSTVANALARRLGLEATHLDDIHWRPGWIEGPRTETAARIADVTARPRWVIDGNYGSHRWRHADAIQLYVWLDLPLHVTLPRLIRRGIRRSLRQEPICNGNYESLRRTFLHKESLLVWAVTSDARRREEIVRETASRPHVRLRTQVRIDRWLANVLGAAS